MTFNISQSSFFCACCSVSVELNSFFRSEIDIPQKKIIFTFVFAFLCRLTEIRFEEDLNFMKCQRANVPIATDNNALKEGKYSSWRRGKCSQFFSRNDGFSFAFSGATPGRLSAWPTWESLNRRSPRKSLSISLAAFSQRVNLKFAEACKRRSLVMRAGEMDMRAKQFS